MGLSIYAKWYLENRTDKNISSWYGGFHYIIDKQNRQYAFKLSSDQLDNSLKVKGEYFKLDRHLLKKLAFMVDPKLTRKLYALDDLPPCDDYKAFHADYVKQSFDDHILYETSGERAENIRLSEYYKRKLNKLKSQTRSIK